MTEGHSSSCKYMSAPSLMRTGSSVRLGAVTLITLGLTVLVGWTLNISALMTVLPGRISMKPNTALGFMFAGFAILYLGNESPKRAYGRLASTFACLVMGLGVLTLVEYGAGLDLGLDQLLFKDAFQNPYPGRMAHITAVNFSLAGVSLLLLTFARTRAALSQLLSLLTGAIALFAIIGYLYGVPLFYGSVEYTSMALHTGVGFLILSVATLHCRPDVGIIATISSAHAGGWLARRLIPIAIGAPIVLGAIYVNSKVSFRDMRLALACLIVVQIVIFVTLIWTLAYRLNHSEMARAFATEARASMEEKYRNIFEETIVGVFRSTPSGKLLLVNPAMARIFGYESGKEMCDAIEAIADQLYVDPKGRKEFQHAIESAGMVQNFECELYRKDGSKVWVSTNARAAVRKGVVVHYDGTFEDITERKSLEAQLRQAQKMEAIGRLAGGIAHDFNNAIGVVMGYSALLKDRVPSDETALRYADEIGKAGNRAARLTRQLLAFSRKQVIQPLVLDLNSIVTESEKMFRTLIGEDIELVIVRDPKLGRVRADVGQMEQVLVNLVVNARDAMPRGGRLVIETANAELDVTNLGPHVYAKAGSYVVLSVSDTGVGMSKETQAKIFEPFFTTKPSGQGTGLGLSTVYGIVKQSEGYVWVYSEEGQGARFKVFLPRVEASAQPLPVADTSAVPGGTETILLVEDDEAMRALTRNCLESGGYTVLDVHDGETAIRRLTDYQGRVHMVLTDVIMPGLSGRSLVEILEVSRPEIRVLYMSGYTADIITDRGMLDARVDLLEKPFTREALLRKVRRVLHAEPLAHKAAAGRE